MTAKSPFSERASGWLESLGALALFAMMAVTFIDIVGRFVLHRPLAGSIDLVQVLLLLTAGCTLPAVTWRGEHLSIGLFDGARLTAFQRARRAAVALVLALSFGALGALLWGNAGELATNGDVIGYLRLPVAPFVYALSVLCMAAAVVALAVVRRSLRGQGNAATSTPDNLQHSGSPT